MEYVNIPICDICSKPVVDPERGFILNGEIKNVFGKTAVLQSSEVALHFQCLRDLINVDTTTWNQGFEVTQ